MPGFGPGLGRKRLAWLGLLALAAVLAGCDTAPLPPAMSPLATAKRYGYAETPLGDARYEIRYVGPYRRLLRAPGPEEAGAAAQRTTVFHFALWRAAQLAAAQGFPGVRVGNVRSNVNTYADDAYEPLYGPAPFPDAGYPFGPRWGGPYWGPSPYVYQQAEVKIEAQLLRTPGAGDYLAKDVIDQLRRTYPGAEGTPPAAPPASPPPG